MSKTKPRQSTCLGKLKLSVRQTCCLWYQQTLYHINKCQEHKVLKGCCWASSMSRGSRAIGASACGQLLASFNTSMKAQVLVTERIVSWVAFILSILQTFFLEKQNKAKQLTRRNALLVVYTTIHNANTWCFSVLNGIWKNSILYIKKIALRKVP